MRYHQIVEAYNKKNILIYIPEQYGQELEQVAAKLNIICRVTTHGPLGKLHIPEGKVIYMIHTDEQGVQQISDALPMLADELRRAWNKEFVPQVDGGP